MTPQQGTPEHMDRRVLDPTQRAHARPMGDTWIVTAGLGTVICASRDDADTTAMWHNDMCGFEARPRDRRES